MGLISLITDSDKLVTRLEPVARYIAYTALLSEATEHVQTNYGVRFGKHIGCRPKPPPGTAFPRGKR